MILTHKSPRDREKTEVRLIILQYISALRSADMLEMQLTLKTGHHSKIWNLYHFIAMSDNIQSLESHKFKTNCQTYPRVNHRTILIDKSIFVFGGTNFHNDFVTSILRIDCQSYQIFSVETVNSLPVEGHSLAVYKDKIYIWGGRRPFGCSNELWEFHQNKFTKVSQHGQIPSGRHLHGSVTYAGQYMIIYGGMSDSRLFDGWYALNLEDKMWQKLKPNIQIANNLKPKMTWFEIRGFLLISEYFHEGKDDIEEAFDLYEFKIRKKGSDLKLILQKLDVTLEETGFLPRASPAICQFRMNSVYLMIVGGERFKHISNKSGQQNDSSQQNLLCQDAWLLNLQTFVLKKASKIRMQSKYGMEPVFYKDRVLVVGGVQSIGDFTQNLETIDLKYELVSIDRKLCMSCRSVYGLEDLGKQIMKIKCEFKSNETVQLSASLVKKFAEIIRNPIKAFGLLIDNSIMMNVNLIEIEVKAAKADRRSSSSQGDNTYIEYTENSEPLSKKELIEYLYSFGSRTLNTTYDKKLDEELEARKEYGNNLKLAALRLGESCLFMTNTAADEKFVGYFSVRPDVCSADRDKFVCLHYCIDSKGVVSSTITRKIIQKHIQGYLNLDKLEKKKKLKTKIFIFDFDLKREMLVSTQKDDIEYKDSDEAPFLSSLKSYLSKLYLNPYVGRTMKLMNKNVDCQSLQDVLRQMERKGYVERILLNSVITQNFSSIQLYVECSEKLQTAGRVYIYSVNRLLSSFDFGEEHICGYVSLKANIGVKIGSGQIQSSVDQKQLKKYLTKVIRSNSMKRQRVPMQKDDSEDDEVVETSRPKKKNK